MLIKNPILSGFHPDPCICRRGDDYYIAVSSFEWFPGIPVYHSRDMKHWELYTHVLTDERTCDLKRLPSAKGIWAPFPTGSLPGSPGMTISTAGYLASVITRRALTPAVSAISPPVLAGCACAGRRQGVP